MRDMPLYARQTGLETQTCTNEVFEELNENSALVFHKLCNEKKNLFALDTYRIRKRRENTYTIIAMQLRWKHLYFSNVSSSFDIGKH